MYAVVLWSWICLVALLCTAGVASAQSNPMRAPKALRQAVPPVQDSVLTAPSAVALDGYVQFFQQVISPLDGARSTMSPTGSAYARQAIQKHGALLGTVMAVERLMHEGNESQVATRIRRRGVWRTYDPVAANDWWWHGPAWVYRSPSVLSQEP